MQTGMLVEKNKFAGNPIIASMLSSFRSLVLIFSSAPPLNKTPANVTNHLYIMYGKIYQQAITLLWVVAFIMPKWALGGVL